MSSQGSRLDQLYAGLTATERGVAVLQAWKKGEHEHGSVRDRIPREQIRQFNRLIASMNAANSRMGLYVVEAAHSVDMLVAELDWLLAIELWSQDVAYLGMHIDTHGRTPVTESDHQVLVEAERARLAPVVELAEQMADMNGADEGRAASDAAWRRARRESERQLRALVADGTLRGRRTKAGCLVEVGSFCDWSGASPFVMPDWGPPYEVRPDAEAERVAREQRSIEHVRGALQSLPRVRLARHIPESDEAGLPAQSGDEAWTRILGMKATTAQQRWRELRAVEVQFDRVGETEFDGESPALPAVVETITQAKAKLEAARKTLCTLGEDFEFEEPGDDDLAEVRKIYEKGVELES